MQSDWCDTTIGAQATLQRGIDITKAEQRPGVVPVVSSSGIASYHDTAMVQGPGVVLGRKGVVGSVFFIRDDFWPHDTSLWVKDFHGNDPRFVYYFFKSIAPRLALLDVGSANPTLNRNHVHPMPVRWPSLPLQLEIALTLGVLDDRIDLLRQTNATLESIARALFKSWFIDFDPVRAKVEGREPEGMDTATAALFPAEFYESAIGPIPKGWAIARLGDILELVYGKALKSSDRRSGCVPVYGSGGIAGYHDEALVDQPSVIVGRKGSVGTLHWEDRPFFPIDTTFYVKPRAAPLTFCYYAMQRLGLENMNTDAAVPGLNRENAYRLDLVRPKDAVMDRFDTFVGTLRSVVRANIQRVEILTDLRDALLPRLISGKLSLPMVQNQVEFAEAIA